MVTRAGEDASDATRRLGIRWGILFGVLLLAFGTTVLTLNSTLYSPSGFVSSYLDALARHDLAGALAMPGVDPPDGALSALLVPDALGPLSDYTLTRDRDEGDGIHRLSYQVRLGSTTTTSTFLVEYTGARMGVFSGWQFVNSPITVLEVVPKNDARFAVNGVELAGPEGANQPYRYQVSSPGVYTLEHESKYLAAEPTTVVVDGATTVTTASVDVQASQAFVDQVNLELADYLDECATQEVLKPTGCPFGQSISNRIEGLPAWSIAQYPEVTIAPSATAGTWLVPPTPATAHLVVKVRSLFDGSLSTFDEDVPFEVEYAVTFPGDGTLLITPR